MDKEEDQATNFLSRVDSQVLRQQSQWLQTIVSELDMKINGILSIIVQDDGDTFAKRAEMYYQKRPELVQMVEDLQKSYRVLAEKYDQLRSQLNNDSATHPIPLTSSLSRSVSQVQLQGPKNYVEGDDEIKFDQPEEKKNVNGVALMQRNASDGSHLMENEKLWNELRFKVSELVDDNISHQSELIKRNNEKRGMIRDLLRTKMNSVDDDSVSVVSHKVPKKTRSRLSRLCFGRKR